MAMEYKPNKWGYEGWIASGSIQGLEQHMQIEGPRENTSNGKSWR